jgi:predicted double-glycine peptidase
MYKKLQDSQMKGAKVKNMKFQTTWDGYTCHILH